MRTIGDLAEPGTVANVNYPPKWWLVFNRFERHPGTLLEINPSIRLYVVDAGARRINPSLGRAITGYRSAVLELSCSFKAVL